MRLSILSLLGLTLLPSSLLLPLPGCGGQSQNPPGGGRESATTSTDPTSANILSSGGEVDSSDGRFRIEFPAGAFAGGDAKVTVTPSQLTGALGAAYDVAGSEVLARPALVTIFYKDVDLAGASPQSIRVGTYVHGRWQALAGYTLDPKLQMITATTTSFAPLAITVDPLVCLSRSGNWQNAGAPLSGSSSSGSSGGAPTSSPPPATPPTCAQLDPCADVPTATKTDCEVSQDGTWQADCCYDPHVPYCYETGGGSSGSSSGGPAPVIDCTTASCGDGASVSSCTDYPGGTGYDAQCCYPPGVLPSNDGHETGSSSGSSSGGGSGSSSGTSGGGSSGAGSSGGSSSSSSGG